MQRRDIFKDFCVLAAGGGLAALIGATALPAGSPYFMVLIVGGAIGVVAGLSGMLFLAMSKATSLPSLVSHHLAPAKPITFDSDWPQPPPDAARVYLPPSITPEFVANLRRNLSGIQADRILEGYVGKWMRVIGRVYGTGAGKGEAWVHVVTGDTDQALLRPQITLVFDRDLEALDLLQKGDPIAASGQGESAGPLGLILRHCELRP